MKKLLIVSPYFPPVNAPDMQRVRMSLPYYADNGWEPVVLAVDSRNQGGNDDPSLEATLPPGLRIEWCGAAPLRLSRRIGVGTLGLRCWPFMFRRGSQLLRREKFDLVFFSNTQFVTFTMGPIWKRRFGVPYVLDFQDPWVTDYYERPGARPPPGGWKYNFARLVARTCEGACVRRAGAVMSVSPGYLKDFRSRYPSFASMPAEVIRFGGSLTDLAHAAKLPSPDYIPARTPGEIRLVYTGASGPVMPHALTVLFDALRLYLERKPEAGSRLRFHFVGTSYAPPGMGKSSVVPVAERCGVARQVFELPHRIGHLDAIRLQEDADVLLLLGSSDLAYSPSKVYPYFLTGRPILAVVFRDSELEKIMDDLSCATMIRFTEAGPKGEAHAALHRFFDDLVEGLRAEARPHRKEALFNRLYLAEELTRRQTLLFEAAVAGNRKEPAPSP